MCAALACGAFVRRVYVAWLTHRPSAGTMVAWAGVERMKLGLWEEPPGPAVEGDWVDLRPRWPLTDDRHPRMTIKKRKCDNGGKNGSRKSQAESLTSVTQQSLSPRAAADEAAVL